MKENHQVIEITASREDNKEDQKTPEDKRRLKMDETLEPQPVMTINMMNGEATGLRKNDKGQNFQSHRPMKKTNQDRQKKRRKN